MCCNCIKEGKSAAHPFPELLAFYKTGEAILRKEGEVSLDLWLAHDKWYRESCSHSGHLICKRLGNSAAIGHVREFGERNPSKDFPLFLERVAYSVSYSSLA